MIERMRGAGPQNVRLKILLIMIIEFNYETKYNSSW